MSCSPHDAMMIILASCLQLLGLRPRRHSIAPHASSRHDRLSNKSGASNQIISLLQGGGALQGIGEKLESISFMCVRFFPYPSPGGRGHTEISSQHAGL